MVGNIILSGAQRTTLASISNAQSTVDSVTSRLSSGLAVESATDDPQNFFTANGLRNRASDLNRILDGIGQSIHVVEEALIGVEATSRLLDQAESIVIESQTRLAAGEADPAIETIEVALSPTNLSTQIQSRNPVAYFRLNDTSGPAVNLGSGGAAINSTYAGGAVRGRPALYNNGGDLSAGFNGGNNRIDVPDSTLINTSTYNRRTVELVFNADTTAGRQVLFEEGATVNGFTIYIDNGLVYVTAEDDGNYADVNINAPINAGETYHVAFVFDRFANSFTGYLNGQDIGSVPVGNQIFPSHSGNIAIGGVSDGVQFHDGESSASTGFGFIGRISDVAIYNTSLSQSTLASHADSIAPGTTSRTINKDYESVLGQIDQIALDAEYRGTNLLYGDDLVSLFNVDGTSRLVTKSGDFTVDGFGLSRFNFNDSNDLDVILQQVRDAKDKVRAFSKSLSSNLNIIKIRLDFSARLIHTYFSGGDDLTLADINREAANQLASQTRLSLSTTALSLASASQQSVLRLF